MAQEDKGVWRPAQSTTEAEAAAVRKCRRLDLGCVADRLPTPDMPDAGDAVMMRTLSRAERQHVLPASSFHFAVISARRARTKIGRQDIARVQKSLCDHYASPIWYVDEASLNAYKELGVEAVVGGTITEARNAALVFAESHGQVCVQVSDDISGWTFLPVEEQSTDKQQNNERVKSVAIDVSPLEAARYLVAKMRGSSLEPKPRLGGLYPCKNGTWALENAPFGAWDFIIGDFFVVDVAPAKTDQHMPLRFDHAMTLKCDFDFTLQNLVRFGSVCRCNRLLINAKHDQAGGASNVRDPRKEEEKFNAELLSAKWGALVRVRKTGKNIDIVKTAHGRRNLAEGPKPLTEGDEGGDA